MSRYTYVFSLSATSGGKDKIDMIGNPCKAMLGQALSQMTSTGNHPIYSAERNRLIPCEFIAA
jgi:hypothetical protein